ncbi:MAG: Leucine dehydrogenase [Chlamydiae bacterium]|nr:Leucine dehydrogenase [Chlamydiota bacterium]
MGKTLSGLIFHELEIEGYERVVEATDQESGLHAIISLHNTRLGPAIGGTRMIPYPTFEEALQDVLRLSKGMTYKSSVAETGSGGGKSVIIADPATQKTEELLLAFAEAVNHFQGKYIAAIDSGIATKDLETVGKGTSYVIGLPSPVGSGDPSPFTAFGGFKGIQAAAQKLWGSDSLKGKRIAIQGLGGVGMCLAEMLFWAGAELVVSDIDLIRIQEAEVRFGAQGVLPDEILRVSCDILAPCAMGAILNPETIPHLKCRAVAGLANNQLLSDKDGQALFERGILYAPDYVINSGGLFNVCAELEEGGYQAQASRDKIVRIYDLLLTIFTQAEEKHLSTMQVAEELAEHKLIHGVGKRAQKTLVY